MLDPQLLRNKTEEVAAVLQTRGYLLDVERFQSLEKDRKQLQIKQQELQHSRNQNSKEIGKLVYDHHYVRHFRQRWWRMIFLATD